MKSEEELRYIIRDNEYLLPSASEAHIVFFDKEGDEVIIEVNLMLASPKVNEDGDILVPNYQQIRHALRLKLKFSDFFMMSTEGQPVLRDIAYSMQKLDEALKKIEEYENANVKKVFDEVAASCENLPLLGAPLEGALPHGYEDLLKLFNARGDRLLDYSRQLHDAKKLQCAHATGKHDQECDLVSGLSAELKDAREEVFDLYHQACLVHPNSSDDPIREFQYDNMCLSTYESIEEKLIEWGMLKPEQCLRRPLKTNLLKDTLMKVPVDPAPVTPEWADEEKKA